MMILKKAEQLQEKLNAYKEKGLTIGFVPTMGALHQGHISLIEQSRNENEVTVCSIFINPTQFNNQKDFEKYPVTIEADIEKLVASGTTILFLPELQEMYPQGTASLEHYPLGYLETVLEGQYRPGHFQGVCQIVNRLLKMVQPHHLYMGQKDYQQCMVIKKLLELTHSAVILHTCPTLREEDGLAMSSRNIRLKEAERSLAKKIAAALFAIKNQLKTGDLAPLVQKQADWLEKEGFKVDYVAICDAGNLAPVTHFDGQQQVVALIAAYINDVRLIDNMLLN